MHKPSILTAVFSLQALFLAGAHIVRANGTETLGNPNIALQPGTTILSAGTGLYTQPGTIPLNVPAGATVRQVLLYWDGAVTGATPSDATLEVNGNSVTGTLIGGPTNFSPGDPNSDYYSSYRADITGLGLIQPGANNLTITGLNNDFANDGAGLLVVLQEGIGSSEMAIRDGLDLAYWQRSGDLLVTVPQTFTFNGTDAPRTASLTLFVGSVDQNRPNQIKLTVDGQTTTLENLLFSNNGDQWDTLVLPVNIPAGATSLTVELVSTPVNNEFGGGASLAWVTAALAVPVPQAPNPPPGNPGTRTQGFWKNHPEAWPISSITLGGVTYSREEAIDLMEAPGRGDKTYNLAEQLIAAMLNVEVGNDASCVSEAIDAANDFLQAHPIGSDVRANSGAWKSVEAAFNTLGAYNEGQLCVPHANEDSSEGPATPTPDHPDQALPTPGNPDDSHGGSQNERPAFDQVSKHGKKMVLSWHKGVLEEADDFHGPWKAVPNSGNTCEVQLTEKAKFYRLR